MSRPDQFADELRVTAGRLATITRRLEDASRDAQRDANEFDRVVEERDELRAEVARMRPIVARGIEWLNADTHSKETEQAAFLALTDALCALRDEEGS